MFWVAPIGQRAASAPWPCSTTYSLPQEAVLYHNQTAELRQLLEYTRLYLQADDEVSIRASAGPRGCRTALLCLPQHPQARLS